MNLKSKTQTHGPTFCRAPLQRPLWGDTGQHGLLLPPLGEKAETGPGAHALHCGVN